jgi:hypothetical protein
MDELPPSARALLDAARDADDPSPVQRSRSDEALRAALARRGIDGLPPLANTAASAARVRFGLGSRGLLAAKLGAGVLAAIAVSVLGVRLLSPTPRAAQRAQPAASPEARGVAVPAPRMDVRESSTAVSPTVEAAREAEHRVPANAPRRTDAHRSPRSDGSLAGELRTVAAVDALVREQRFDDALQMLEHTESASSVVLHEERNALRILARCGLAPTPRALRERDRFLRDSPRSVLAERVRSACNNPVPEVP